MYHYSWLQNLVEGPLHGFFEGLGLDETAGVAFLHAWVVCGILLLAGALARSGLEAAKAAGGNLQYVPDSGLTLRNLFEGVVIGIGDIAVSVLGAKDARRYFWALGGLFVYVLVSNLMGLVPGLVAPSSSFHNNFAMGLFVTILFTIEGLRRNGMHFIKHLFGPVWWLAFLIGPIEILANFAVRPYSLALRLTGNMFGDHMVFGIMSELVPLVWPSVFLGLGIFVSMIQALVFTLLTTVYIALAVAPMHDHH